MKKQLRATVIANELRGGSAFFPQSQKVSDNVSLISPSNRQNIESASTPTSTQSRDTSRDYLREIPRELPSRDDIQMFSFQLRDQLKTKVQAEVPYHWQEELEEIARQLKVKKLELYRYIIGAFLGKTNKHGRQGSEPI